MDFDNFNILYFGILFIMFFLSGIILLKVFKKAENFDARFIAKLRNYEYSQKVFGWKLVFLVLSFIFVGLAVLRPQWGVRSTVSEAKGVDIVFSLDVSKSMEAIDIKVDGGEGSRIDFAKTLISNFVTANPDNRYGLVIFAGEAFVSTPLTLDSIAFLTFLDGTGTEDVYTQGTNLEAALKASVDRFNVEDSQERGKSIVLISDGGEETSGNYQDFSKVAKKEGIKIFTVGVGSSRAVEIPEGVDVFGNIIYKQYQGEIVKTKLNEKPLKEIADSTDGQYFQATSVNDLDKINSDIENLQSTIAKKTEEGGLEDRYQYFLLPALLLFAAFVFLPAKKYFK